MGGAAIPTAVAPDARPPLFTPAYGRLLALQACFGASMASFVLLPKYLVAELEADPAQLGLVMAGFSVANVAAVPLVGIGVDHFGRRALTIAGLAGLALAALGFAYLDRVDAWVYALRALQGAAFACTHIANSAMVVDHAPPQRLGQALGLMGATYHAMNSFVPWVVERTSEQWGWAPVFWAAGGFAFLAVLLALGLGQRGSPPAEAPAPPGLLAVLGRRPLQYSCLLMALVGVSVATAMTFIQPYALERGIARVASFFVMFSLVAMVVRVGLGSWMDRSDRHWLCVAATAGYALVLLLSGGVTASTLPWLGALMGVAHGLYYPSFQAMNLQGVSPRERGRVLALLSGSLNLGHGGGTLAIGGLAAAVGYATSFVVAAGGAALACGILLARRGASRWSAAGS